MALENAEAPCCEHEAPKESGSLSKPDDNSINGMVPGVKASGASQEILNEPIFQIALLFLESLKMAFLAPWSLKAASGAQKLRLSDAGSCVAHSSTTSPLIATQKQAQR